MKLYSVPNLRINSIVDRLRKWEKINNAFERLSQVVVTLAGSSDKKRVKIIVFGVQNAYEFLSVVVLLIALGVVMVVLAGSGLAILLSLLFPLIACLQLYVKFKKYRERVMFDLIDVIEVMLQGLNVGMPVEKVLEYVGENKQNNIAAKYLNDVVLRVKAGQSLKQALNEISEKALSTYFERMARVLSLRSEATTDITKSLITLHESLLALQETSIMTKVERFGVTFIFYMLIGYVLPFMVVVLYPLIVTILKGGIFSF